MLGSAVSFLTILGLSILLLLAGCWLWFQWSHRRLLKVAAKLPVTLPTIPFVGHGYLTLWGLEECTRSVLGMTVGAIEKGIKTLCFWIGPVPLIVLQDMDDIQIVLNGSHSKADEYDYFISGMDSGEVGPFRKNILSSSGMVWKVTRKHLNPMFHPRNIQQIVPVFNTNSRELVERISHHLGHGPVNVMEYTMDVGLKTICNLIFGPQVSVDVSTEAFKGLMFLVESIPELFIVRLLRPWLRIESLFRFIYRRKIKQLNAAWRNFTVTRLKVAQDLQKEKKPRENIFSSNHNSSTLEDQEPVNFFDVYRILQQNYPDFNEADLTLEILALYCTGTDTVGSGAASCLLALAQYQDIQERLHREVCTMIGHDNDITLEDLSRMPYLDMVIKETLRRFLIVPFVLRKATKDIALSECTLPVGAPIAINLAAIHMDPKIYPNPTNFDPERFSPENSACKEKFSFIPFSGGPRNCIAKTYAMNLIKIVVIHVLRKYRLYTTQDIHSLKKKLVVTLVSAEGYNITLESRYPDKNLVEND